MNGYRSRTRQTHNRDKTNLLLTKFEVRTISNGSSAFPYDLIKGENTWFVTYGTDLKLGY